MENRNRRKDWFYALALCVLALVSWVGRLAGPLDLRADGSVYYTLGTSLYEGKGYRLLNEPGEIRANQCPPLLPAIVALHQMVAGTSDPFVAGNLMRRSWMVLYLLYIPGVFWLAKRYVGRGLAVVVALIVLLNPLSSFLSDWALTEFPYGVATLMFFLFYRERHPAGSVISFISALACYLLRAIGIALLAAWVLDAVRQRRFRLAAVRGALAMLPVAGWQMYVHSVETSLEYQRPAYSYQRADYMMNNVSYAVNVRLRDPFHPSYGHATSGEIVVRTLRNLGPLTYGLAEVVTSPNLFWHLQLDRVRRWLPWFWPAIIIRGSLLFLALLIFLGLSRVFQAEPTMAIFIALSLLAISAAPWPSSYPRYMWPFAPYLAIALVLGLAMVGRLLPSHRAGWLTATVIGLVLIQQAIGSDILYSMAHNDVTEVTGNGQRVRFRLFNYSESFRALDAAQDWIRERTRRTDVIAGSSPHWLSVRTGRKAIMAPYDGDPQVLERLLAETPVTYLVVDDLELGASSFVAPAIERSPNWRQVFTYHGRCRVFERIGRRVAGTAGVFNYEAGSATVPNRIYRVVFE